LAIIYKYSLKIFTILEPTTKPMEWPDQSH
jgi:hypothetical protein